MGEIQVRADRYWGAQTQRSLENFKIGPEKMPLGLVYALALVKKAAALANLELGVLDERKCALICRVCDEIASGALDDSFPLSVWQTGSGTQTNMNVNEVIANRALELESETPLHPNDDVNRSQSTNCAFPSAMHVAAATAIKSGVLPALAALAETLRSLESEYSDIIKIGRTHMQDATPIRFSQEISGWREMLERSSERIAASLENLMPLALGGTAVGTGLGAPDGFTALACKKLAELTDMPFVSDNNKFYALASKDALASVHGELAALAANLIKLAEDVRLLASGPDCGIGEINLPANEPGSSIMAGKVNPTQCEALIMVGYRVIANNASILSCAAAGRLELNVCMPLMTYDFLQSCSLLAGAARSFDENCARGITPNRDVMERGASRSLMLAAALNAEIGYDGAARVVKLARERGITLREAALELGLLTAERFDAAVRLEDMV